MLLWQNLHLAVFRVRSYLRYVLKRTGAHGLHPPFVFELYTRLLSEERRFYAFDQIEALRSDLARNEESLEIHDFGAGSVLAGTSRKRTIADIVRTSSKPARHARLMFRLAELSKPDASLELGTNLGLTTAYLAKATAPNKVFSIEGSSSLSDLAADNLEKLGIGNAVIINGNFDDEVPRILAEHKIDFFFLDGNHTREATLRYWEMIRSKIHSETVIVLDDIHWSPGMESAWNEIIRDPKVKVSLDFFWMGVLFFRDGLSRQHFTLKLPN